MDGRGRALDNIFVERLWRTVKYEHVYLQEIQTVQDARSGLRQYFEFYNHERLHQSLGYRTPAQVYLAGTNPSEQQEVYQPAAILIQWIIGLDNGEHFTHRWNVLNSRIPHHHFFFRFLEQKQW